MNGRCRSQQARGHCRNNFVMNDFPVLAHTATLQSVRKTFKKKKKSKKKARQCIL